MWGMSELEWRALASAWTDKNLALIFAEGDADDNTEAFLKRVLQYILSLLLFEYCTMWL